MSSPDRTLVVAGLPFTTKLRRAIGRHWLAGGLVGALTAAVAVFGVVTAIPKYRAEARLQLGEPPPPTGVSASGGALSLLGFRGDPFANDLELLRTRTLAEQVVEATALQVRVDAPKGWHRDSLFVSLVADRSTRRATYEAVWGGDGRVTVRQVVPVDSAVAVVDPGTAITFGGVTAAFRPHRTGMPERIVLKTLVFDEAVRVTSPKLIGRRVRREANLVALAFDHTDPALARAVVDETVRRFIVFRNQLRRQESQDGVDSVRTVAAKNRAELARAETDLQSWQRSSGIVAPTAQNAKLVERHADLIVEAQAARAELAALDRALARARENPEPGRRWVDLVSFPRFLQNETVGQLTGQLVDLDQKRVALAARRTPENLELKTIQQSIEALSTSLVELASQYRNGVTQQVERLDRELATADSVFRSIPEAAAELGRRERQVRLLSEVYLATEQRLRQEELRSALTTATIQVVDPAQLRSKPVWPRPKLQLAIGVMLALLLATVAVAVSERLDPTLRTMTDIVSVAGSPFVGMAIRSGGGMALDPDEARKILARANGKADAQALVLASASRRGRRAISEITPALVEASSGRIQTLAPNGRGAIGYSDATAAARATGGVLLVVEPGRTARHELARAVDMLRRAGASIAGVVVICHDKRDAEQLWG